MDNNRLNYRVEAARGIGNKLDEFQFFLNHIIKQSVSIYTKKKNNHLMNTELDELNYYFSAFLNSVSSLKNATEIALGAVLPYQDFSSLYERFIQFCNTSITHDGAALLGRMKVDRAHIPSPLPDSNNIKRESHTLYFDENIILTTMQFSFDFLIKMEGVIEKNSLLSQTSVKFDIIEVIDAAERNSFSTESSSDDSDWCNSSETILGILSVDQIKDIKDKIASVKDSLKDIYNMPLDARLYQRA